MRMVVLTCPYVPLISAQRRPDCTCDFSATSLAARCRGDDSGDDNNEDARFASERMVTTFKACNIEESSYAASPRLLSANVRSRDRLRYVPVNGGSFCRVYYRELLFVLLCHPSPIAAKETRLVRRRATFCEPRRRNLGYS